MSSDQPSLFDWTPPQPTRTMIPFPQERRKGDIRRVAQSLRTKKEKAASRFWQLKIDQIRRQMSRAGFSEDEISSAVRSFHNAVQSELDRVAWATGDRGSRPGGGGAA